MMRAAFLLSLAGLLQTETPDKRDAADNPIVKKYVAESARIRDRELNLVRDKVNTLRKPAGRTTAAGRKARKAEIEELEYLLKHPEEFFPIPSLDMENPSIGDIGKLSGPRLFVEKEATDGAWIHERKSNASGGTVSLKGLANRIQDSIDGEGSYVDGPLVFVADPRHAKAQKGMYLRPDDTVYVVKRSKTNPTVLALEPVDMAPIEAEIDRLKEEAKAAADDAAKKAKAKSKPKK